MFYEVRFLRKTSPTSWKIIQYLGSRMGGMVWWKSWYMFESQVNNDCGSKSPIVCQSNVDHLSYLVTTGHKQAQNETTSDHRVFYTWSGGSVIGIRII